MYFFFYILLFLILSVVFFSPFLSAVIDVAQDDLTLETTSLYSPGSVFLRSSDRLRGKGDCLPRNEVTAIGLANDCQG